MTLKNKSILPSYINLLFIIFIVLVFVAFAFYSFKTNQENTIKSWKKVNEDLVGNIHKYAELNYNQHRNDKLTEYQAKENVKSYIKTLNNRENNKIWLMNFSGFMHIHPVETLEHRNLSDYQNNNNVFVYQKIINPLKTKKSIYLKHTFPASSDKQEKKLIYAQKFKHWGWIIVNELPLPEKEIFSRNYFIVSLISVLVIIIVFLIYLFFFHNKSQSASKKLLETEKKYQTLFRDANDGILLIEKYRFIDCNPKALELYNATKAELIGSTPDQFSPEYQPDGQNSYDRSIDLIDKSLNNERQFFEWLHKRTDGSTFYAEVSVNKIEIENRDMLLAIVRDTTARKNLEKKLIKAKNKAEESDRLKSAFLANTSHEIRTPMNAIVGFSKLLKSGKLTKQKQAEYTNNILEKGNQLLQIINDIIDVSKIEANQLNINKSRFSLNKLFDEIHHDFKNEIERNDQIELFVNREVKNGHYIYMDKTRVKQIISNLLSNAFKYTDKGKIETGYKLLDKDNILFFVKDTGIGVDKEKQDIIFDSFRKSDNSTTRLYGGTGLGLSISKALVELMGGKIWVESELNKGASFYFTLPYEPAYKVNEDKQMEESKTYNWKGKKILIVEDDELSYEYLKEILKDTEAKILHAKDGQAAIDYCKEDQSLDLVLMDIQLPGIDGNTATQKIREFDEDIPVIAQTAYALEEEKKKILQAGCNDYVSKPINEEKLYEKIHNYLG
jgi:PAS domain S-box-containing protein